MSKLSDVRDRITYIFSQGKQSIDLFESKLELFSSINSTAIVVLALLISKVLKKAVEMSEKIFHTELKPAPAMPPKEIGAEPIPKIATKAQIPPEPDMPTDAAASPKLHKIYNELQ